MKRLLLALAATFILAAPSYAQDAFDLKNAILTPNVAASWPATAVITLLGLAPNGFHVEFTKKDSWPDVIPAGWDGPIEYTLWVGAQVNGTWHLAASVNVWRGEDPFGGTGTVPSQYSDNLYYLDSALKNHLPAVGEPLAFMVTAGAARGLDAHIVAERSNVVVVPLPTSIGQTFTFGVAPVVVPTPNVDPPPSSFEALAERVSILEQQFAALQDIGSAAIASFESRLKKLESRPIVASCIVTASVWGTKIPVQCKLGQ